MHADRKRHSSTFCGALESQDPRRAGLSASGNFAGCQRDCLRIAVLPDEHDLVGGNLIPYLTGNQTGASHEVLFWRWIARAAVRNRNLKYPRNYDREYLFDMATDFEETKDLLASDREIAKSLKSELSDWAQMQSPSGIWDVRSDGLSNQATGTLIGISIANGNVPVPPAKTDVGKEITSPSRKSCLGLSKVFRGKNRASK